VPPHGAPVAYLAPLLAVALVVLRNMRARRLRVERLWIAPAIVLAITALLLAQQPPPSPLLAAGDALALGLGALGGWWRGRLTRIAVDPQTHALTSQASPVGMLLILAIFAVRYTLRSAGASAGLPWLSVAQTTDLLMLFAVGLVCAQRLEMAVRAARLLKESRR